MMKNKAWLKIAMTLDKYGCPRAADYFDREIFAQNLPYSQYNQGAQYMSPNTSAGQNLYTDINELLAGPLSLGTQLQYSGPRPPAGPTTQHWMLSGIPQNQTLHLLGTGSGTGSGNTIVGVSDQANPDWTCFMNGYTQLPKYLNYQIQYIKLFTEYYGLSAGQMTDAISQDQALSQLADIETLFNDCLYLPFLDCGGPTVASGSAPSCIVPGGYGFDPSNPPMPPSFQDYIGYASTAPDDPGAPSQRSCADLIDSVQQTTAALEHGPSGAQGFQNLFARINEVYTQLVTNGPKDINQWEGFRYVLSIMGNIGNNIRAYRLNLATAISGPAPVTGAALSTLCNAQHAASIYSAFFARVYGSPPGLYPNGVPGAPSGGLPSYITSNWDQIIQCAEVQSDCDMSNPAWQNLDFADISIAPPQQQVNIP